MSLLGRSLRLRHAIGFGYHAHPRPSRAKSYRSTSWGDTNVAPDADFLMLMPILDGDLRSGRQTSAV